MKSKKPTITSDASGHKFNFNGKMYGPYSTPELAEYMRNLITKPRSPFVNEANAERARMRRG